MAEKGREEKPSEEGGRREEGKREREKKGEREEGGILYNYSKHYSDMISYSLTVVASSEMR